MLVLTRRCGEAVLVGPRLDAEPLLTVTVLEIGSGKVRLGFEVKREMLVHRWEVWQRMLAAGRTNTPDPPP